MKNYNGSENAGVSDFEFTENGIILKFKDGRIYLYSYKRPGREHVEKMKTLALNGSGLTTYVNQHIRNNYDNKLQ